MSIVQAQESNPFPYRVGDHVVYLISEGQSEGNPSILIGADQELLDKYIPDGTFPNAVNTFLVKGPGKAVLFDTGFGRNIFTGLNATDVSPDKLDAVMLTHMHGDHIGGMFRDGKPSFPSSRVTVARAEHDYWSSDQEMNSVPEQGRSSFTAAQKVFSEYAGSLDLVDPVDIGEVPAADGIYPVKAYGHTPGHVGYMIVSKGDKLFIWGDLTHAMAIQMPHPEISVSYDVDPDMAAVTRMELLHYIAANEIPVAGMHIAYPGVGKVVPDGNGYRFVPIR